MLRIMKQSDIGPFGVVAIVGVLLVDVAALTACIQAGFGWQAILIATTASRLTLPWSCRTTVPAARPDGLGALVAATVRPITAAVTTVVVLAAALLLAWLRHPATAHGAHHRPHGRTAPDAPTSPTYTRRLSHPSTSNSPHRTGTRQPRPSLTGQIE